MSYAGFEKVGETYPDRLVIEAGIARVVTIASGAGKLRRGSVIGKVTASRKFLLAKKAAADGSAVPEMILADDVDATSGDVQAVAYLTGKYNSNAIHLDESLSVIDVSDAFRTKSLFLDASLT